MPHMAPPRMPLSYNERRFWFVLLAGMAVAFADLAFRAVSGG